MTEKRRPVVLGAKLGQTLYPPPKDSRKDSPGPMPAVIPPDDPPPNFRKSTFWRGSGGFAKWISIVAGVLTAAAGCTAACSSALKELRPTDRIKAIEASELEDRSKLNEVIRSHNAHIAACETFREASGSAWSDHPNGEVKLPGVDQGRKVKSESLDPPVSKVDVVVLPLPKPIEALSEPAPKK